VRVGGRGGAVRREQRLVFGEVAELSLVTRVYVARSLK
jgi:hypothetical protein